MNETPETLRAKSAQVAKLALTVANEKARLDLLEYAQELLDQAQQLERTAANLAVVVDPEIEKKAP